MGIWESVRSTVSMVTGTSAKVRIDWEEGVVTPGKTVPITVVVDNATAPLEIRQVLVELRAVEQINVPRDADPLQLMSDALEDGLDSASTSSRSPLGPRVRRPSNYRTRHFTFRQSIRVGQASNLEPNESQSFEGRIPFPMNIEPTFSGKYCQHRWELRGRVDVFGKDPSSGWSSFRVCVPS